MAAPVAGTAVGHAANPTTSATATLGTTAADTILIAVAVNAGSTTALTLAGTYGGGAWSSIGAGAGTAQWGGVWWSRCTGNHSGQTVIAATATDSCSLIVQPVTGCLTSGSPVDTNVSSANLTANGLTLAAFDTTVVDTLVMLGVAADDNIAITSPTKGGTAMAISTAASTGGADSIVGLANVSQASAGTTGAFAGTHASTLSKRLVGFALKPPAAAVVERSVAVDATGTIAVAGEFFSVLEAAVSVTATGTIATTGLRIVERSASLGGAGAINVTGQRDLQRSVAVTGTGAVTAAGQRDLQRAVSVTGTGSVTVTGSVLATHERSVSLTGTGTIEATGHRVLDRAVSLTGTGTVEVAPQRAHVRQVSVTGTGTITVAGSTVGVYERQVSLAGVSTIAVAGVVVSEAVEHPGAYTGRIEAAAPGRIQGGVVAGRVESSTMGSVA